MENDSLTNTSVKLIILIINLTDIFDISNNKKKPKIKSQGIPKKKANKFFSFYNQLY